MPPTKRFLRDQRLIDLWHPAGGNRSQIARELGLTRARVAQLVVELRSQRPGCLPDYRQIKAATALEPQRTAAIKALEYIRARYRRPLERAREMREDHPGDRPALSCETEQRYALLLRGWEYGVESLKQGTRPPRPSLQAWCKMFLERDQRYAFLLENAQITDDLNWLKHASKRPSHHSELIRTVRSVARVPLTPAAPSPHALHRTESRMRSASATSR